MSTLTGALLNDSAETRLPLEDSSPGNVSRYETSTVAPSILYCERLPYISSAATYTDLSATNRILHQIWRSSSPLQIHITMSQLRRTLLLGLIPSVFATPLNNRDSDPPVPVIAGPDSQIFPCTATLVANLPCPTGPPLSYATTETLYQEVDCKGCLDVTLHTIPEACSTPTEIPDEVHGTATAFYFICSPTPTLPIHPRGIEPRQGACTTKLILPVGITGVTATVFKEYITVTRRLPCGGCELVTSTGVGGLGVIAPPGVTVTVHVGTRTAYGCLE